MLERGQTMKRCRMFGVLCMSVVVSYAVVYAEEPRPPEPPKTNWKLCALHLKIGTVMKGLVLDQPGMAIQYDNGGPILPFSRDEVTKIEPLPEDEAKAVLADIAKRRKWSEAKRQQAWEDAAPAREAREAEYQEAVERARERERKRKEEELAERLRKSKKDYLDALYRQKQLLEEATENHREWIRQLIYIAGEAEKKGLKAALTGANYTYFKSLDTLVDVKTTLQQLQLDQTKINSDYKNVLKEIAIAERE